MRYQVHPLPRLQDGRPPSLTSGFNLPGHPGYDKKGRNHRGADFLYWGGPGEFDVPDDTPALAVLPGLVVYAELNYEPWWVPGDGCTGYVVVMDHGGGLRTAYHHLLSLSCKPGDMLLAGQHVGIVGGSPNRAGAKPGTPGIVHLHLDAIRIGAKHVDGEKFDARKAGAYTDPAPLIKGARVVQLGEVWLPPVDPQGIVARVIGEWRRVFGL